MFKAYDFKSRLVEACKKLQEGPQYEVEVDENLWTLMVDIQQLANKRFYCHRERCWIRPFDAACYAWKPHEYSI